MFTPTIFGNFKHSSHIARFEYIFKIKHGTDLKIYRTHLTQGFLLDAVNYYVPRILISYIKYIETTFRVFKSVLIPLLHIA